MCSSMTSSQNGLQSLASRSGFPHYTKSEARASAKDGCLLCDSICKEARKIWTLSERLIFFAFLHRKPWAETASDDGALSLLKFDSLNGYGADGQLIISLTAMTASSK
jgi:hypothetical protein